MQAWTHVTSFHCCFYYYRASRHPSGVSSATQWHILPTSTTTSSRSCAGTSITRIISSSTAEIRRIAGRRSWGRWSFTPWWKLKGVAPASFTSVLPWTAARGKANKKWLRMLTRMSVVTWRTMAFGMSKLKIATVKLICVIPRRL